MRQDIRSHTIQALLAALLLACLQAAPAAAMEYREQGWPTPDTSNALRLYEYDARKDLIHGCPGVDVYQEVWAVNAEKLDPAFVRAYGVDLEPGTVVYFNVNRILPGRRIMSYYLDSDGAAPMDFTLVDQDGDGVFRHLYTEPWTPTPDWIRPYCGQD
jgi:hypothetical protein